MKRGVLVLTVLLMASTVTAQTWDEWFNQKKTQIKYLVEQITALEMYGSAVKKGYDVVNSGLSSIGRLKESDLLQHEERFGSLSLVKQSVKGSAIVQRIYALQLAIQKVYSECKTNYLRKEEFSSAEKNYFKTVLTNVLDQCSAAGEETMLLVSDGKYQMSDDERLKRLQDVCSDMVEQYVFIRQFQNEVITTAVSRLKEQKERKLIKLLY